MCRTTEKLPSRMLPPWVLGLWDCARWKFRILMAVCVGFEAIDLSTEIGKRSSPYILGTFSTIPAGSETRMGFRVRGRSLARLKSSRTPDTSVCIKALNP